MAFFGLLLWLAWVFDVNNSRRNGPEVFRAFSYAIFFFCLVVGAAGTADSLSREKRDGTLGLLFLTNLNSAEIVAGKLCSHALAAVYSLLAIFPVLALPLLLGGVPVDQFWRTVLALLNALGFALAAGFVASSACVRQFPAVALAMGLALFFGAGLAGVAEVMRRSGAATSLTDAVAAFCPLNTLLSAENRSPFVRWSSYWPSLAMVTGMSWTWLQLVAWAMRRSWQDRPKKIRAWQRLRVAERLRKRGNVTSLAFRRRLLAINPFFWLAGRQRVSAPGFMLLSVALVLITVTVTGPYFGRTIRAGSIGPVIGHMLAWLFTGLAMHALALYYAAAAASQRLAEDKQTGALELILCTPASERAVARGLWLAYGRKMFFPVIVAVLVHGYFIWMVANAMALEPRGLLPISFTPGELLWAALLDEPIRGHRLDWHFGFMLRGALLVLVVLLANWITLGWVGRWLGLRMKHPGFAPLAALTLVIVPPILGISLACYLADQWRFTRLPERQFLPLMLWLCFAICITNCLALSLWAAGHLRRDFRLVVTSRFQPPSTRRWWQLDWRRLRRMAVATALVLLVGVLSVLAFWGYQSWRSHRAWATFQRDLKQKGVSLDVATLIPAPIPPAENFTRAATFQTWSAPSATNAATTRLFTHLKSYELANAAYANSTAAREWTQQGLTPLGTHALALAAGTPRATTRAEQAAVVLRGLAPQSNTLRDVAVAARLPFFQNWTNRNAWAVMRPNQEELLGLERVHLVFQMRACALLATGRGDEAGEDLLTGLQLARLARQSPDIKATVRVHVLLLRSLQPLWEGLAEHRWNAAQLATFQSELARFNLLADHTNALHRVALAHIEIWQAIPGASDRRISVPVSATGYMRQPAWDWQPRAWWFDNCIQLYQARQNAMDRVDVAGGYVRPEVNWSDFSGLPLDNETSQLFQQNQWNGASPLLVAYAQTAVNQAIIACALERQRLAAGRYPETLEPLVPQYFDRIPYDIARGRPMIYQTTTNNSYILHSVGPNGVDERAASDDWVWAYATNKPPVRPPRATPRPVIVR